MQNEDPENYQPQNDEALYFRKQSTQPDEGKLINQFDFNKSQDKFVEMRKPISKRIQNLCCPQGQK
jgi:hypothetical protein